MSVGQQYVAVCCSVVQCVAVCCSVLVVFCSVLKCVACVYINTHRSLIWSGQMGTVHVDRAAVCCSVLQCVAVWCSMLQCVKVYRMCIYKHTQITHLERPDGYSSCHDDRCVLITNIPPFDPPTEVKGCVLQCVAVCCSVLQCAAV